MAIVPTLLRVGDRLDPDRQLWPEGPHYNFACRQHVLSLFYERPTLNEVVAYNSGQIEFGLYVEHPVLLLLFRPRGFAWCDASYSWHKVTPDERELPSRDGGGHALLNIVLADIADGGRVMALRSLTLSPAFTTVLHTAIRDQEPRRLILMGSNVSCLPSTAAALPPISAVDVMRVAWVAPDASPRRLSTY